MPKNTIIQPFYRQSIDKLIKYCTVLQHPHNPNINTAHSKIVDMIELGGIIAF